MNPDAILAYSMPLCFILAFVLQVFLCFRVKSLVIRLLPVLLPILFFAFAQFIWNSAVNAPVLQPVLLIALVPIVLINLLGLYGLGGVVCAWIVWGITIAIKAFKPKPTLKQ